MGHDDFDDGLVHGHDWANDSFDPADALRVEDATSVNTPSSVFHDDTHHID